MPDNTNVNNNASVVVVGRTAPVPPGQQKSDKSVPVVIASDQSTIPVAEQNKVQSEVALSLLGIPRSEVALGIFADVNTYDVNPTEWAAEPDQFSTIPNTGTYAGAEGEMNWGLSHVPQESGALVEAPPDKTAILTSKRFFRYQPGRVSAATFGVKTTIMDTASTDTSATADTQDIGSTVYNPAIRKYGIFDNFDGYYWETRNNGQGDNFCVVRRTQSLLFNNPVDFSNTATPGQTEDFGATNPLDPFLPRGNETPDDKAGKNAGFNNPSGGPDFTGTAYTGGFNSTPDGFENVKLGDLVIYRDNLMMTHAAVYDPSLLQDEQNYSFTTDVSENELHFDVSDGSPVTGIGKSITNAVYDISSGIMTVTTAAAHGFGVGKFVHLSGIGMTCRYSYANGDGTGAIQDGSGGANGTNDLRKVYPDRTPGYSILRVDSTTSFVVNVGVSTVPTFFDADKSAAVGAVVLGLSTSQYVSYNNGSGGDVIDGLTDQKIYKVNKITYDKTSEKAKVELKELSQPLTAVTSPDGTRDIGAPQTAITLGGTDSSAAGHSLVTPVPFVQPVTAGIIPNKNPYNTIKRSGMFPYVYKNQDNTEEGYIDTTKGELQTSTTKSEIELVNVFYENWINQNVKKEFWNVYEYRVPRSRFSGDRLDNQTDDLLYSDVTAENRAGSNVTDPTTGEIVEDISIWDLEFNKVTMYKVEFSWYGAVGALFLAYVPVGAGEARWVRVHHLRASNQLKGSSLGNATLPITYLVYGGGSPNRFGYTNDKRTKNDNDDYGSPSEHIIKYGASYYIDGGDRGTVKLFSHGTQTAQNVFGSKRSFIVGAASTHIANDSANMTSDTDPYLTGNSAATGFTSSYYVGAKVFTGNVLDQNIEVVYVDTGANKLHLNMPLAAAPGNGSTIDIIANRPKPLIGLKCRDFIVSSQGREVRNRTQVYPTRLSTGSEGSVIKVDLLKTPIFQTTSTLTGLTPTISAEVNIGKRSKPTLITISNNNYLVEGTGVYGYFRGKFEGDASNKTITVLGYLERRLSTSPTPGYYFNALDATTANIILDLNSTFLYEGQLSPEGVEVAAASNDFTLDALSSIKVVNPLTRAPIPKTGTVVASLFIPASGEEFDLSSYFDYNKEYLSFPLTNVVESLFVVGSSDKLFSTSAISSTSASITWEEQ